MEREAQGWGTGNIIVAKGCDAAQEWYLSHKEIPPRRTLQWPCAWGPMVILGGWVFLMREVPL